MRTHWDGPLERSRYIFHLRRRLGFERDAWKATVQLGQAGGLPRKLVRVFRDLANMPY